jgi:hypothetical protein
MIEAMLWARVVVGTGSCSWSQKSMTEHHRDLTQRGWALSRVPGGTTDGETAAQQASTTCYDKPAILVIDKPSPAACRGEWTRGGTDRRVGQAAGQALGRARKGTTALCAAD